MASYEIIERDLDNATRTLHQQHISEYTNYVEFDGVWYKRSIKKLKKPPELD